MTAVLTAWFGIAPPTLADGVPAAITPPLPRASLPSPELPRESEFTLTQFKSAKATFDEPQRAVAGIVARQANISNFGTACGPSLSMTVAPDAMLAVRVSAPCLPYDAIWFEHEELAFTVPMPLTGELAFLLPALDTDAELTATLSDGTVLNARNHVPDARNFARVALQWSGADPGELVAKAPRVLDGKVIHLGQSPDANGAVLQVFSSRISDQTASGVVRLSMRAPVTAANCGSGQVARVRRMVPGEPTSIYGLILNGPGCGAIGQSLQLNNVLQDLKLSGN
ncbi:hypothetical protein [Litoreibacter meonggei]|nr:hypothetical protein [Litoreibacter meonggei]